MWGTLPPPPPSQPTRSDLHSSNTQKFLSFPSHLPLALFHLSQIFFLHASLPPTFLLSFCHIFSWLPLTPSFSHTDHIHLSLSLSLVIFPLLSPGALLHHLPIFPSLPVPFPFPSFSLRFLPCVWKGMSKYKYSGGMGYLI